MKDMEVSVTANISGLRDMDEELVNTCDEIREKVIDLKCTSMRGNLFSGVIEEENEDCEETVKEFMWINMRVRREIKFERVHHMGRYRSSPIAAHTPSWRNFLTSKTENL
jgi:hypothetical protein